MAEITDIFRKDLAFASDFVATASGDLATREGMANYEDAMYRRLITYPGELVHRPGFGVGVKSFQNSINNRSQQQKLAVRIKEQFEQDPRTERVLGVSIPNSNDTPEKVEVHVRVQAVGRGEVNFTFRPFGGT